MELKSKAEAEKLVKPFSGKGAYVRFTSPAGAEHVMGMDSLHVVRANPIVNSNGDSVGLEWWLGWFPIDWRGMSFLRKPHTSKITKTDLREDYWLHLVGDLGEVLDLQVPAEGYDEDFVEVWEDFQRSTKEDEGYVKNKEAALRVLTSFADEWTASTDTAEVKLTDSQLKRWQF